MTCFWDDDFSGLLTDKWVDISTGVGSAQISSGTMQLDSGTSGVAGYGAVQNLGIVEGDFQVTVKITSQTEPNANYSEANLVFKVDATHYITIGSYHNSVLPFYSMHYKNGATTDDRFAGRAASVIWLRLVRSGADVTAYYSINGSSFSRLGDPSYPLGTANGSIILESYKWSTLPEKVVNFDNFVFDSGCPPVLPTVITSAATDVSTTTATGNGEVTSAGGGTISQRGFVWSTSANPTTADSKIVVSGTLGVFSGSLTGLNRVTTYHVRAFASNEIGTAYGADVQFDTLAALPTVTTSDATSVTAVSATGHGNVTDDGGDTITERGFVWSLLANPTTADTKLIVSGTTGAFSGSITGLSADTTYHYRAYATNTIGTAYGADYTISTVLALPTVITSAVTDIGSSAATANGDVVDAGGGTILERGFAWGTAPNPTITADNKVVVAGTLGVFTGPLVGLTSNVLYHVRAYAVNEAGISYGADVFFTSLESGMGGGGGAGGGGAEPVAVGTVYSPDDEAGVVYAVDVTTGNLLLFYKKIDPLPYSVTDSARWNDGFDLPYTASALALALSAEDDEYDRYRAWIYEFISNSVADSLRNMAINKNVR